MRREQLFNDNWSFVLLDYGTEIEDMRKAEDWQEVNLPHDWLIYDTGDLYRDGTGWYRKNFGFEKTGDERYYVNFDGVYMDSTVYINGREAGTNHYGYSSFEYEITDFLKEGTNEIVVQVRHKSPNTRWYSGAGIFRDVYIKGVPATHIATNGVYISPKKVMGRWVVITDVEVEGPDKEKVRVSHNIRLCRTNPACAEHIYKPCPEAENFVIADSSHGDNCAACGHPCASRGTVRVSDFDERGTNCTFVIENPFVWDIDSPNIYELRTALLLGDEEIDVVETKFGLREIEFTSDRGFFLNGRRVKIYGACEHHDLGCLGAAFNKDAMRRKLLILKEMGVNAIRTSHNMPARGLMELADEMGIMIDSEAFDMWRRPKTEFDYARFFEESYERDVRNWIRRDRNHPSVIMWSIGNEIYDCHADESAVELTEKLKQCVEREDYLHNAPVTHASNYMAWQGARNCTDKLDLAGYNYGERFYDEQHRTHPKWKIYGSETCATVQSRGVYHFPLEVSVMADDDEQCSALGNCTTSWGADSVEYAIKAARDRDFAAGQFIWTGFDYIGEPTPYHTRNSYFGQVDTAGFPKDTYYIFKAEWTDFKKAPFVHVFPYWDFNEGQLIDVRIATNAPKAELFVNGISQGMREIDHAHGDDICPSWKVPYHRGYIEAVAYDENGKEAARERRDSFKDVDRIEYRKFDFKGTPEDEEAFASNEMGRLVFYEIYALDRDGHEVENACCRVHVDVKGGELVGLDNGDSTDHDAYKTDSRRLFNGRLLAVVRVDEYEENVEIGVSIDTSDIPVRKIEIIPAGSCHFDGDLRSVGVEAVICPPDASYKELIWIPVNDYAVGSNLAYVEGSGNKVTVNARGDGQFRLRCMTKNGTDTVKVISSLEFDAENIGTAYINPYEFVAGTLYTDFMGDIGNGNDKGVAMPRGESGYVGFENIDFGDFGADEVTLPIFALDGSEYVIQIWEGRPGESGSELLCDGRYQKPSIWNVYQSETYRLSRRVKGISSIYFKSNDKFHLKGFVFTKQSKAFARIGAVENSRIYGDTFKLEEAAVTGIGNNVTIEFDDMDFGDRGSRKLILCGRAPESANSVHLKFDSTPANEVVTTLLEFEQSGEYVTKSFEIPEVKGMQKVGFVFLPGSKFDLKWFRFE